MKTRQEKIEAAVLLLRERGYNAHESAGMVTIFGDISDEAAEAIGKAIKDVDDK